MRKAFWLIGLVTLLLAGCDAGPSAVMHDGDGKSPATSSQAAPAWADKDAAKVKSPPTGEIEEASMPIPDAGPGEAAGPQETPQEAPKDIIPLKVPAGHAVITATNYGDWPLWSKNRKYTADDNAHYHFTKHGAEFGAKTYADYMAIVHGFIHNPPPGTQTLKRSNGDTLYYDPKQNIFAVATKAGAPRTFFRPDNGVAYWQNQKQVESTRRTITRDSYGGNDE